MEENSVLMKLLEKERELSRQVSVVSEILKEFPDLREDRDRWENVRRCSKKVNAIADCIDFGHSCGCCEDAPLYAWCWVERYGERVFSDPPNIFVGSKNYGYGDIPDTGWETRMREFGMSELSIESVKQFFVEHPYRDWYDDEEEDE